MPFLVTLVAGDGCTFLGSVAVVDGLEQAGDVFSAQGLEAGLFQDEQIRSLPGGVHDM